MLIYFLYLILYTELSINLKFAEIYHSWIYEDLIFAVLWMQLIL